MKKFIKWFLVPICIILVVGIGVIFLSSNFASEKIIRTVSDELESSGKLADIKKAVKSDPEITGFIKEVETDPKASLFLGEKNSENNTDIELPIQSKEEAIKVVIDRVGISDLNKIANELQNGTASKQEVIQEVSTQFTEEELMALKIIAYKELYEQ